MVLAVAVISFWWVSIGLMAKLVYSIRMEHIWLLSEEASGAYPKKKSPLDGDFFFGEP